MKNDLINGKIFYMEKTRKIVGKILDKTKWFQFHSIQLVVSSTAKLLKIKVTVS